MPTFHAIHRHRNGWRTAVRGRSFRLAHWIVFGLLLSPVIPPGWFPVFLTSTAAAQSTSVGDGAVRHLIYESTGAEQTWVFGVEVAAQGGATGIEVTCPIPVDWPEQTVTLGEVQRTDNVADVAFRDYPGQIRLMHVRISRLGPGDVAKATVQVRVDKRNILAPERVDSLRVPARISSDLRPFLKTSPYIEMNDRRVRALAESIPDDPSWSAWKRVETIYDTLREHFPYEFDPTIRTCPEAIAAGKGDCEELSSLFIAVCRIRKIPARAIWIPSHTYPEFYLEDAEGNGEWFPCQMAGSRQFGQMIEDKPVLQKGDKFKLPGQSEFTRYVQPTLTARNAAGGLGLKYIAESQDERP